MPAEDYETGAVKQNPDTQAVAVRTVFPDIESLADRQWGVMTVSNGGHYCTYDKVAAWLDLEQVEGSGEPEPEPEPE